ncbi:hypothetical protein [Methyloglobulus sp.]
MNGKLKRFRGEVIELKKKLALTEGHHEILKKQRLTSPPKRCEVRLD